MPVAAALAVAVVVLAALLATVDRRSAADEALRDVLAAADATVVTLEGEAAAARLVFSADRGEGVFLAAGLADVGDDETYELWLIDADGPRPAGLFRPDGGEATFVVPADFGGLEAVGVTVEPAGGSPQPTGDILILGTTS